MKLNNTMTNKRAVFGMVQFEIHDEDLFWMDGRVYATIAVGDTLYAYANEEASVFAFEVVEILFYHWNLTETERGQVVRLVLKGNAAAGEILKPYDQLFSLAESP
jgi:hypothetical protein